MRWRRCGSWFLRQIQHACQDGQIRPAGRRVEGFTKVREYLSFGGSRESGDALNGEPASHGDSPSQIWEISRQIRDPGEGWRRTSRGYPTVPNPGQVRYSNSSSPVLMTEPGLSWTILPGLTTTPLTWVGLVSLRFLTKSFFAFQISSACFLETV